MINPIQDAFEQLRQKLSPQLISPIPQSDFIAPIPSNDIIKSALSILTQKPLSIKSAQAQGTGLPSKISSTFSDDPKTPHAVPMQESSLNPQARNTIPDRNIDAIGLMQINLPAHLDEVPGTTYDEKAQNLMNPDINLQV